MSAETNLLAGERQASSEVRAGYAVSERLVKVAEATRQAAALAKEARDLAALAYREGATTNLELLDAERRAREAQSAAIVAEDAVRQNRLELLVAAGLFP